MALQKRNLKEAWYAKKDALFDARGTLLGDKEYQCTYGELEVSQERFDDRIELTLLRCCDIVGGRMDLHVGGSMTPAKIETLLSSSDRIIDVLHAPSPSPSCSSMYDITALAPFQKSNLVFPSTRTTTVKIIVTFVEPPSTALRLFGCKYFVDSEHRKCLFTDSHVMAIETHLVHPDISCVSENFSTELRCKLDRNSGRTTSITVSEIDPEAITNVRMSLEDGCNVYNGPAWPLRRDGGGQCDIVLDFCDPACKNYRSLIDLRKHPNAELVLTVTPDAKQAKPKILSTRLEFIAYSGGTMSYALLVNDS
jgi:hypothetical protein